jgi:hypothetical protein
MNILIFTGLLFIFLLVCCVGLLVAHVAREELRHGKRYYLITEMICSVLLAGILAITLPRMWIIPAYLVLVLSLLFIRKEIYSYAIFGGIFAALLSTSYVYAGAAILCIYFLASTALTMQYADEQDKRNVRFFLSTTGIFFLFFIGAALLGYAL